MKLAIDRHIATGTLAGLDRIALAFLAILLASFALEYIQTWVLQMTGQRIMFDMRTQIYGHLQRLDLQFYDRNPVGRLMTRVTTDVDVLNDLFTAGVVSIFGDIFTLAGIMIVLATMDWRLALLAFSVLPLIVLVTQWFRRHVRESYRNVRIWIARINAFLQEHITGMSTVQLFRRERRSYARFDEINRTHRDANVDSIFYYAVFYPAIEIIGALAAALLIWFGGLWTMSGTLTLGSLVAFILYSQRFFRPISDMSEKFNVLQAAMASSERIFKLLDTEVKIAPGLGTRDSGPARLSTAGGSFRTPRAANPEPRARAKRPHRLRTRVVRLQRRRLRAQGCLVRGGAGRAARHRRRHGLRQDHVINLLLRFYDVNRGRILVDGVDVREMALDDLRRAVQPRAPGRAPVLGTIADNIRLGNDDIADADVRRAAATVHADPFIEALPQGYDSPVAERGATLSVGQKQLLSFARALAFDPAVLVLDEATSSVDTETEMLIQDALHVLMEGRTTIAIAHRLSTIQDMDQILVLHKGELREVGHPPGAAGAARHLLQAVSAAVQGRGAAPVRRGGVAFLTPGYLLSLPGGGDEANGGAAGGGALTAASAADSRSLNSRSTERGVLALGFQPRRRTWTCIGRRPRARASWQLHM